MPSRFECANAIRALAMDAVQKANSGHPGMPMGMADIAEVLWRDFLVFNPANPHWVNRDRFILSNGHGAMLQYALLHLTGFDLSIEDLRQFRQWHSKTPGHPEWRETPGVEVTTGPLGQGLAMAVGMALAEKIQAATFNRDHYSIIDHYTYVFAGDGDLMEGVSHEACSLAGTLGLGKLIVFYDDNGISIDGDVEGWFTENIPERFGAYHWHVIANIDGHDPEAISRAIISAREISDRPTIICCKTIIGYGASPASAGRAVVHGAPLGEKEIAHARQMLKWPYDPFEIPDDIYNAWDKRKQGVTHEAAWQKIFEKYKQEYPDLAHAFLRRQENHLPDNFIAVTQQMIDARAADATPMATRKFSLKCIEMLANLLPELIGGSADLSESNGTLWATAKVLTAQDCTGNYIEYGVREFGMSAIMNGLSLYGSFIPFGGTFLTFSDYARNALRLAALMQTHTIFIYSHDSIGLGEDGPTHQPIEQIASLRLIPGLSVWRPCDGVETAVVWQQALLSKSPHCILLTRQNIIPQEHPASKISDIAKGGYILWEPSKSPEFIIIATGSEISLAVQAAKQLQEKSLFARVVSMPCCERFNKQENSYRESVLPNSITKRLAIEAGVSDYWYRFIGDRGKVIGINHFGTSAPGAKIFHEFGFTVENVIKIIQEF